ncbi:MAG: AgmX/PglI C-terminal domain-containing protein [Deltaproteobacteria bacterium]|nr:AgmX/PglI C-terminal domain-containing protein [Deltaproteobacteria bacterium]
MSKTPKRFFISVYRDNKPVKELVPEAFVTFGLDAQSHITGSLPGVAARSVKLFERTGKGLDWRLVVPKGLDAVLIVDGKVMPVSGIVGLGLLKARGDEYLLPLPIDRELSLVSGGYRFDLGFKEVVAPKKKAVKIDPSLKKALLPREDYPYYAIVVVSAILHVALVWYLSTVVIRKQAEPGEALEQMSARFAKLIIKPQPKPVEKKQPQRQAVEEQAKKEEPAKEAKVKEEKPKEQAQAVREEKAPVSAERQTIQAKVKSKGLLGVIMAKTRTSAAPPENAYKHGRGLTRNVQSDAVGSKDVDFNATLDERLAQADQASREIATTTSGRTGGTGHALKEKQDLAKSSLGERTAAPVDAKEAFARDESKVYATVRSYIGGLKFVYNNALRKDPSLKGKLTVKIVITTAGKVGAVENVATTLQSPDAVEAIIQRIYKWKFPELEGGQDFTITYTFDFSPMG